MDDTIVTVRFNDVGEARGALNELKRLDRDAQLRVREAVGQPAARRIAASRQSRKVDDDLSPAPPRPSPR